MLKLERNIFLNEQDRIQNGLLSFVVFFFFFGPEGIQYLYNLSLQKPAPPKPEPKPRKTSAKVRGAPTHLPSLIFLNNE